MTRLPEFKQAEIDKLRAELDHCRNSLELALDTSNHWSDAHATAYARGLAAGRAEALEQAAKVCGLQASELELEWPATIGDFSKHMVAVELAATIWRLAQQSPPTGGHGAASGGG